MRGIYAVGASAIALSAALGAGAAWAAPGAARVVTVNIADYNAAQVTTADGVMTVPTGLATYAVNSGSLEINSRFTVTLPAGFTFGSQPALFASNATTFTYSTGGIGSQSTTFVVGGVPLPPGQHATLNSFAISGATALETPIPVAAALPISMQSTNNAEITNNDRAPLSKPAFASEPGVNAIFVGAIQFIDLSSPSLGTLFASSPDTPTAVIGATAIQAEAVDAATSSVPVLSPDGAPNSISTKDTATLTVPGFFNGIKAAFTSASSSCTSPVAGSTGTASVSQLTFAGIPVNEEQFLCVTADGTTLMSQNPNGFHSAIAPGTSTDFLGTNATVEFPGVITYTGGGIISVTNFFTGDDSGYSSLLRVNNGGSEAVDIFALVQPDTGGAPLSGPLGSLGAGSGTVFTEPQIVAAVTGLNLATSGQRATVQLIVTGNFPEVAASSFLVNPSGVVTNVGVQRNLNFEE
jgi:hypothetical protein